MGRIWGVQPGSAWVPYGLSHMRVAQVGPIWVPYNSPIKKKEMISTYLFKLISWQASTVADTEGIHVVRLNTLWDKYIPFSWGISRKISIKYQIIRYNFQIEHPFVNLDPLSRNPGSAPASTIYFLLLTWASPYGTHMEPGCTPHMGAHIDCCLGKVVCLWCLLKCFSSFLTKSAGPDQTAHAAIVSPDIWLRNRSALAVNCCIIIHCLEVSCKEDQITSAQREWFIFVQLTDKQWIITQQFTH